MLNTNIKVKVKYKEQIYNYIEVRTDEIILTSKDGIVLIIPINVRSPFALYKVQDIAKAVFFCSKKKSITLPLERMLEVEGIRYLFALEKDTNKVLYAKTTLHSNFGNFNKSLLPTAEGVIFIVNDTKNIIANIEGKYRALLKDGKVVESAKIRLSQKDLDLFYKLCNELSKVGSVTDILTKIL